MRTTFDSRRHPIAGCAVVIAALLAAGCGQDDGAMSLQNAPMAQASAQGYGNTSSPGYAQGYGNAQGYSNAHTWYPHGQFARLRQLASSRQSARPTAIAPGPGAFAGSWRARRRLSARPRLCAGSWPNRETRRGWPSNAVAARSMS